MHRSRERCPLTAHVFHILLALADRDRHGYAIIKEVATLTGNRLRMNPGTVYTALRRLQESGLIEESPERPDAALDDKRRRYYRLTQEGREVAATEARRMVDLAGVAVAKKLIQ